MKKFACRLFYPLQKEFVTLQSQIIFFFTSLMQIYWMNVSIFLFFKYKNKTFPCSEEGEASSIFGGVEWGGVVSYINRDCLTVDHSW